jgi:hypothetical protein
MDMKKVLRLAGLLPVALLVTGCAIHQRVSPTATFEGREICVIENPAVRAGFVESYKRSLSAKGYAVRQLPASAAIVDCPVTSTYSAQWRWDLALYMAYAEIKVFSNGRPAGAATYDALRGGGNMNKFIDADRKVNELVNQLFPGGAGG